MTGWAWSGPVRRHHRRLAISDRDGHIVDLADVMTGRAVDQGTKTMNRNTANTTMCTSPNRILVLPVPKVSMLRTKVRTSSTIPCGLSPSTSGLSSA